jgi:hypothetical protein
MQENIAFIQIPIPINVIVCRHVRRNTHQPLRFLQSPDIQIARTRANVRSCCERLAIAEPSSLQYSPFSKKTPEVLRIDCRLAQARRLLWQVSNFDYISCSALSIQIIVAGNSFDSTVSLQHILKPQKIAGSRSDSNRIVER